MNNTSPQELYNDVISTQMSTDQMQSVIITHCTDNDTEYVNVLPRGWFEDNSFETTHKTSIVFEFLQTHTLPEASLSVTDDSSSHCSSEADLCAQCRVHQSTGSSGFETVLLHDIYESESSLCTTCKAHEALEDGSSGIGLEEQSLSISSLCTQCRDSSSLTIDSESSKLLCLCNHCDEQFRVQCHSYVNGSTFDSTLY